MVIKTLIILFTLVLVGHVHGYCHDGWVNYNSSCYYFSSDNRNWVAASGTCRAHGAELVIIDSPEENAFIATEVIKRKGTYWLDGTDEFSEKTWEWASTGTAIDYSNWYPGEPNNSGGNEDCVYTSDSYKGFWNDARCSDSNKFICKKSLYDEPSFG